MQTPHIRVHFIFPSRCAMTKAVRSLLRRLGKSSRFAVVFPTPNVQGAKVRREIDDAKGVWPWQMPKEMPSADAKRNAIGRCKRKCHRQMPAAPYHGTKRATRGEGARDCGQMRRCIRGKGRFGRVFNPGSPIFFCVLRSHQKKVDARRDVHFASAFLIVMFFEGTMTAKRRNSMLQLNIIWLIWTLWMVPSNKVAVKAFTTHTKRQPFRSILRAKPERLADNVDGVVYVNDKVSLILVVGRDYTSLSVHVAILASASAKSL